MFEVKWKDKDEILTVLAVTVKGNNFQEENTYFLINDDGYWEWWSATNFELVK